MNLSKKRMLLLGIFALLVILLLSQQDNKEIVLTKEITLEPEDSKSVIVPTSTEKNEILDKPSVAMTTSVKSQALAQKELISLSQLMQTMKLAINPQSTTQMMTLQLKNLGLNVQPTSNSNPATGQMTILRTENALEGTRYFHAQAFANEGRHEYFQHVSFELRPGPDSFENAITAVSHNLPKERVLSVSKPDYKLWKHSEGYITWIKVMTLEDLKDDPFNAYSKEDVGTVRIVTELDVEEDHSKAHN